MIRRLLFAFVFLLLALPLSVLAQPDSNAPCADIPLTPRLYGGMQARVISSQPLMVYREFDTSSPVVGQVEPGTIIPINTAPHCENGIAWWQSNFRPSTSPDDTPFGWIAESVNGEYVLEPYLQPVTISGSRLPITVDNVRDLQQVARVDYGMVKDITWSSAADRVAISTVGAIWVHDFVGGAVFPIAPNELNTNLTSDMRFSADGTQLATVGSDTQNEGAQPLLNIWSLINGEKLLDLKPVQENFGYLAAVSPDFSVAASATWDGKITLLDLPSGTARTTLEGHDMVGMLSFSRDGQTLVSLGGGGMMVTDTTLRIWDVTTGTERAMLDLGTNTFNLAFSPDNIHVATVIPVAHPDNTVEGEVLLINMMTGNIDVRVTVSNGFGNASFNADGSLLAVASSIYDERIGGWAGGVTFLDANTGEPVTDLPLGVEMRRVSFSEDGTILAVVYADPGFWGPDRVTFWTTP